MKENFILDLESLKEKHDFSVKKFIKKFRTSKISIDTAKNKDLYLVVGHTEAGKSLSIGYLMGADVLKFDDPAWTKPRLDYPQKLRDMKKYPVVGHTRDSTTPYPQVYPAYKEHTVFIDAPGYNSTKGLEDNICISMRIKQIANNAHQIKGVIVVIGYVAFLEEKGKIFKEILTTLSEIFSEYESLSDSVLFVFTKVPKGKEAAIKFEINRMQADTDQGLAKMAKKYFASMFGRQGKDGNSTEQMQLQERKAILELFIPTRVRIIYPDPTDLADAESDLIEWKKHSYVQRALFIFDLGQAKWKMYLRTNPKKSEDFASYIERWIDPSSEYGKKLQSINSKSAVIEQSEVLHELELLLLDDRQFKDYIARQNNIAIIQVQDGGESRIEINKRLKGLRPFPAQLLRPRRQDIEDPKFLNCLRDICVNGNDLLNTIDLLILEIANNQKDLRNTNRDLAKYQQQRAGFEEKTVREQARNTILINTKKDTLRIKEQARDRYQGYINILSKEPENGIRENEKTVPDITDPNKQILVKANSVLEREKKALDRPSDIAPPTPDDYVDYEPKKIILEKRRWYWPWGCTSVKFNHVGEYHKVDLWCHPKSPGFSDQKEISDQTNEEPFRRKYSVLYKTARWKPGNATVSIKYAKKLLPANKTRILALNKQIDGNNKIIKKYTVKRDEAQAEVDELQSEINALNPAVAVSLGDLNQERRRINAAIEGCNATVDALREKIQHKQVELEELKQIFQNDEAVYQIMMEMIFIADAELPVDPNIQAFREQFIKHVKVGDVASAAPGRKAGAPAAVSLKKHTLPDGDYWEVDVPRDGACLFHSVVISFLLPVLGDQQMFTHHFYQLFGNENILPTAAEDLRALLSKYRGESYFVKTHANQLKALVNDRFRKKVVEHMRSHPSDFKEFIEDNGDFNQYLDSMLHPTKWGGEQEINAIAAMLQCKIIVHQENRHDLDAYGQEHQNTIHLIYRALHYQSFISTQHLNIANEPAAELQEEVASDDDEAKLTEDERAFENHILEQLKNGHDVKDVLNFLLSVEGNDRAGRRFITCHNQTWLHILPVIPFNLSLKVLVQNVAKKVLAQIEVSPYIRTSDDKTAFQFITPDDPYALTEIYRRPGVYSDFIGVDKQIDQMKTFFQNIAENPKTEEHFMLLVSPPGLGKTKLTEQLARELGFELRIFETGNTKDKLVNQYGVRVSEYFQGAKTANRPVCLFFDEIDALVPEYQGTPSKDGFNPDEIVVLIQKELDRLAGHKVVVIGATNYLSNIKPAIQNRVRNHIIHFRLPDLITRHRHIADRLRLLPIEEHDMIDRLAEASCGWSSRILESYLKDIVEKAQNNPSHTCLSKYFIDLYESNRTTLQTEYMEKFHLKVEAPSLMKDRTGELGLVGLSPDVEHELKQVCLFLKETYEYRSAGIYERHVLLYGPPGTGKTAFGRAVANTSNAVFILLEAGYYSPMYLKNAFERAKNFEKAIIFIDEIDGIMDPDQISVILTEMDGLRKKAGTLVVICATNHPEQMQERVKERFNIQLEVPLPNIEARTEMFLSSLIRSTLPKQDIHFEAELVTKESCRRFAKATDGWSMRKIKKLLDNITMDIITEQKEKKGKQQKGHITLTAQRIFDKISESDISHKKSRMPTGKAARPTTMAELLDTPGGGIFGCERQKRQTLIRDENDQEDESTSDEDDVKSLRKSSK